MTTNAVERLYLMQVATATVPPDGIPFPCYLVQTGDGRNILIDSGLPTDIQPPPGAPPVTYGKTVIEQLALLGLRPTDIDTLICTHFDGDHTGFHASFTHAELIAQRRHYEVARSGHERFALTRAQWDHPALRYRLVDGDTELLPSLELIETSGHAPGHQSVLVRLPQTGPVLLTIDAVLRQSAFTPDHQMAPFDDNQEELSASTRKLLDLVEREHIALVIFGHDGAQWQTLKKAPEAYS